MRMRLRFRMRAISNRNGDGQGEGLCALGNEQTKGGGRGVSMVSGGLVVEGNEFHESSAKKGGGAIFMRRESTVGPRGSLLLNSTSRGVIHVANARSEIECVHCVSLRMRNYTSRANTRKSYPLQLDLFISTHAYLPDLFAHDKLQHIHYTMGCSCLVEGKDSFHSFAPPSS